MPCALRTGPRALQLCWLTFCCIFVVVSESIQVQDTYHHNMSRTLQSVLKHSAVVNTSSTRKHNPTTVQLEFNRYSSMMPLPYMFLSDCFRVRSSHSPSDATAGQPDEWFDQSQAFATRLVKQRPGTLCVDTSSPVRYRLHTQVGLLIAISQEPKIILGGTYGEVCGREVLWQ